MAWLSSRRITSPMPAEPSAQRWFTTSWSRLWLSWLRWVILGLFCLPKPASRFGPPPPPQIRNYRTVVTPAQSTDRAAQGARSGAETYERFVRGEDRLAWGRRPGACGATGKVHGQLRGAEPRFG